MAIHEECGVFGVFSAENTDAARLTYYGLYALQHRGQEACGIVVGDDGLFYSHKDTGLVGEVFHNTHLDEFPMGNMAVFAVSRYIKNARNKQLVVSQASELFLNLNGQPLTRQGFWKILKTYKEKANIKADITPHSVRHTFAVHMLENGTKMKDVQLMLGNSSQSTSALYKKMLDMHIKEVYASAHPRAKIK